MEWIRGEVIGRGSFGTVNLATLTNSNKGQSPSVVVKSSHISNSSSLKNEKEVLTKLGNSHQNIIKYLGDCVSEEEKKSDDQFYNIFLEYASKGSLSDYLRKSGGIFGISQVRRYTMEILKGLSHVHEQGFVHCDVKLQNVLVFEDDSVKLADFGLSRRVGENGGEIWGTPMYMSPEVVAGGKSPATATAAADVWAVGCAVVEMATGGPAWECAPGCDVAGLFYRIGVRGECPRIPEGVCDEGKDFLEKCFLKDPSERWTVKMLLDHPFMSRVDDSEFVEKTSVSPKCPFEFPDWESTTCSSVGSGSVESFDDFSLNSFEDVDVSCWSSISYRFEEELVGDNRVPDWNVSNGWVVVR